MKRRNFIKGSLLAAGVLATDLTPAGAGRKNPETLPSLLRRVRLLDLESGKAGDSESDIKIENGRISEIALSGEIPSYGLNIIEGNGRFALPGLIDCHAHTCGFFMVEMPGPTDMVWIPRQIALNYRAHLKSGVTTVRDMMAPLRMILRNRAKAEDPRSGYPRILCSGPMITVPGGYPPHVPPDMAWVRGLFGPLRVELKKAGDAANWVDRLADAGVDWIKIGYAYAKSDEAKTPLQKISPELFRAVVDRAHHHNLPVAVHHSWLRDLEELIDLPFDSLEHLTGDSDIAPQTIEKMAKRDLSVTTDIEVYKFLEQPKKHLATIEQGAAPLMPKAQKCMKILLEEIAAGNDVYEAGSTNVLFSLKALEGIPAGKAKNLKLLHDRGIRIGASTDAGTNLFFGSLPDEMCTMAEAGMSSAAVLRAATSEAAKLLKLDDCGSLKKGFLADFVLYGSDPISDIKVVKKPEMVIRDGLTIVKG